MPKHTRASAEICAGRDGGAYVAMAEIERFQVEYATIAMISRSVGIHFRAVQRLLEERNILPTFDPAWLEARIYRQADVAGFITECGVARGPEKFHENGAVSGRKAAVFAKKGRSGESDDAVL